MLLLTKIIPTYDFKIQILCISKDKKSPFPIKFKKMLIPKSSTRTTSIDILNNVFVYNHAAICIMRLPWHRKKESIFNNYHKNYD